VARSGWSSRDDIGGKRAWVIDQADGVEALSERVERRGFGASLNWTDEVFSRPRVENSLARGMPATLQFHAELWRRRRGWFDRLVRSFDASLKIRYDVWSKSYLLEQKGHPTRSALTLDSLATLLSHPLGIPVAPASDLERGPRYYVVMSVTLKPLTVEGHRGGRGLALRRGPDQARRRHRRDHRRPPRPVRRGTQLRRLRRSEGTRDLERVRSGGAVDDPEHVLKPISGHQSRRWVDGGLEA
jgi:hypothetical protein